MVTTPRPAATPGLPAVVARLTRCSCSLVARSCGFLVRPTTDSQGRFLVIVGVTRRAECRLLRTPARVGPVPVSGHVAPSGLIQGLSRCGACSPAWWRFVRLASRAYRERRFLREGFAACLARLRCQAFAEARAERIRASSLGSVDGFRSRRCTTVLPCPGIRVPIAGHGTPVGAVRARVVGMFLSSARSEVRRVASGAAAGGGAFPDPGGRDPHVLGLAPAGHGQPACRGVRRLVAARPVHGDGSAHLHRFGGLRCLSAWARRRERACSIAAAMPSRTHGGWANRPVTPQVMRSPAGMRCPHSAQTRSSAAFHSARGGLGRCGMGGMLHLVPCGQQVYRDRIPTPGGSRGR